MLAGVGGRTVAEAKRNMSYNEALRWRAYRDSVGPFNLGSRLEQGFALVAMMINRVNGGKAKISDFVPDRGNNEPVEAASAQDLLALLNSTLG